MELGNQESSDYYHVMLNSRLKSLSFLFRINPQMSELERTTEIMSHFGEGTLRLKALLNLDGKIM